MKISHICPPHLSDVATLPWEIQKVIFQQYYSYILQIIYAISEENKYCSLAVYLLLFSAFYYYRVWGTLQEERVYREPVRDTDELQQCLVATG